MPPLIGWVGASGDLTPAAWLLCLQLFLWQFPHFMAIVWMYRGDHLRAGYLLLPHGANSDRLMFWQTLLPSAALIPVGILQPISAGAAPIFPVIARMLSVAFFRHGSILVFRKSDAAARHLLFPQIVYLPFELIVMMLSERYGK
jgi:protoheme IX farnesyltransferase